MQKFIETGDRRFIYQNKLDKACFQNDMIASDKMLRDKAFNMAKNSKFDGYQRSLALMVYNFFDKKPLAAE